MSVQIPNILTSFSLPGGGATKYTDDFQSYTADITLTGQGPWVACMYDFNILVLDDSGNKVVGSTNTDLNDCVVKLSTSWNNDQYAKATVYFINSSTRNIGVAVRCTGTTVANAKMYGWFASTAAKYLFSYDGAGGGVLISTSANGVVNSDIIELRVVGTTITCKLNGATDTTMGAATAPATGNNGVYSDSVVTTGSPGISAFTGDDALLAAIDNFECDNI